MWLLVLGCDLAMAVCFTAIAGLVLRRLRQTRQLGSNPLALATVGVFLAGALVNGSHGLALWLVPASGRASEVAAARSLLCSWPHVVLEGLGAAAAIGYLLLRHRHRDLVASGTIFGDLADARYRQLAANLPHTSVLVVDTELRYAVAEGDGLVQAGADPRRWIGRHPWEVMPAESWAQLESRYRSALEGDTSDFDATAGGLVFHVRAVPLRGVGGSVVGAMIVAEDVTEQREAWARLRETQAFGEAVLTASPDTTVIVDLASGQVAWFSRTVAEMLDWNAEEDDDGSFGIGQMVLPEDQERLRAADAQLRELPDGESVTTRFRVEDPDGGIRWLSRRATPFARDASGVPRQGLCVLRDVTDAVESEQRLQQAALHDPLTGLPNRALLLELLTSAIKRHREAGDEIGLLFCDLDGFKLVNDTHGHAAGDALLVEVARRLQTALRQGDCVARVGGDEFVVLVEPSYRRDRPADERLDGAIVSAVLAERLRDAVARPVVHEGVELGVSLSVGVTTLRPGSSAVDALRDADAALYRAKRRGRNRVEIFDELLRADGQDRRRVETALRAALARRGPLRGALGVVYQPVLDLGGGRLVGFEALARLTGGDGRPIPPDRFIPVAEETGLIDAVGELVLTTALEGLVRWRRTHAGAPGSATATMAVNLSARQIQHLDLPRLVGAALGRHGLEPSDLTLEVTESVLLESGSAALGQLTELRAAGVGIAIDDFGTGYASLRYLTTLPVSSVKVDRTFTAGLCTDSTSAAIVRAVAALAVELDLECVVEGIETTEQLSALPAGVLGQGYLLGRPGPLAAGEALPAMASGPLDYPEPTPDQAASAPL